MGIILCGENPYNYGFEVPKDFYDLLLNNFQESVSMTEGIKYEWNCLQQKASQISKPFIIENEEKEKAIINKFLNLQLSDIINTTTKEMQHNSKLKYIIRAKHPKLFNLYLIIRRQLKIFKK